MRFTSFAVHARCAEGLSDDAMKIATTTITTPTICVYNKNKIEWKLIRMYSLVDIPFISKYVKDLASYTPSTLMIMMEGHNPHVFQFIIFDKVQSGLRSTPL